MRTWTRVAAAGAALVVSLAACGGSGSSSEGSSPTPSSQGAGQITVQNIAFRPQEVSVAAGTTVTWTSKDDVPHTVTSGSPGDGPSGEFDAPLSSKGSTFSQPFAKAGTFPYYCKVHPQMTGTITVT